jgi:hypothetical protein
MIIAKIAGTEQWSVMLAETASTIRPEAIAEAGAA